VMETIVAFKPNSWKNQESRKSGEKIFLEGEFMCHYPLIGREEESKRGGGPSRRKEG